MKKENFKKGMMLAEILVAVFIFSITLSVLININNFYLTSVSSSLKSVKAAYLAEEGMEAVRIIRDTDFSHFINLNERENYYLHFINSASSTWEATSSISSKNTDGIDRWFVLDSTRREYNKITTSTGDIDLNTKKVTVYVSWDDRGNINTKSFSTYLTKIIPN